MDNEKKNTPGEELDWFSQFSDGEDPGDISDTDQEAQAWLDELLGAVDKEVSANIDAPIPEEEPAPVEEPIPSEEPAPAEEPAPKEPDIFQQMVSPLEDMEEIGADEHAASDHRMTDIADMELDKIMQEAMSDDWDVATIEQGILSEPIEEAFPAQPQIDIDGPEDADLYSDDGEDPEEEDGVQRKVRPRKKNVYGLFGLPHAASMAVWAALCLAIGITLGRWIWIMAADILGFEFPDETVSISVTKEDDLESVIAKLEELELIRYPSLFRFYCQLTDTQVGVDITVGAYTLNKQYDYHAIVEGMSSNAAYRQTISVMIPEGYTCAQIFAMLEEKGVCTAQELEQYCIEHTFDSYWFLEGVEKGTAYCLEGYLFPDTYEFYIGSTARQVFIKLLGGFENHITEELQLQLDALNETLAAKLKKNGMSQSYIDEHKLTMHDVIIVASMIEKESAYSGESQNIASVIYNRLTNPTSYPYLNIDATIVYALGGKTDLTTDDLSFDSPYNTYLYKGLPPGPISNPGLYSIMAALNPSDTKYYFYALDTSGESNVHQFFRTYDEHQAFLNGG